MHRRSFGLIMLLLAIVAVAPGVSIVAGLLLMVFPAFQMILGQNMPVFPRRIAARPIPTMHLAALVLRAVPVLRSLEKLIHPRWPTPLDATKRAVGAVVVLLNITLLFTPVPLSNIVPALVIALISLAYLEEDGILLSIAMLASIVVLAIELVVVWETVLGGKRLFDLWS
ncbi:exopolysaccharide biosynthesis protein [Bradyrhizobium liaoningense]|nr:exopolysaccharide biosynthesis protein [Bradyrhizobium liaoningense]